MFVLMEVKETGFMDLGSKRDAEGNQYVQAKDRDFHKTPLDVFIAAIRLLKDKGYEPRYSVPLSGNFSGTAFLADGFGLRPNEWGFVDIPEGAADATGTRFVVTKPKPEQTRMEGWKLAMPKLVDYIFPGPPGSVLDYNVYAYSDAVTKWIEEMPGPSY